MIIEEAYILFWKILYIANIWTEVISNAMKNI